MSVHSLCTSHTCLPCALVYEYVVSRRVSTSVVRSYSLDSQSYVPCFICHEQSDCCSFIRSCRGDKTVPLCERWCLLACLTLLIFNETTLVMQCLSLYSFLYFLYCAMYCAMYCTMYWYVLIALVLAAASARPLSHIDNCVSSLDVSVEQCHRQLTTFGTLSAAPLKWPCYSRPCKSGHTHS